jgi:hypothetical protein
MISRGVGGMDMIPTTVESVKATMIHDESSS